MTKASSESRESSARVLVIDDEVQIRRFLRISLASQGYEVIEAGTGEEGLDLAATRAPDLVVLDLGLPGMDGKEVLAELRGWSSVPVMILSVRADEGEKVKALDKGANDYVVKPFGMQEFLARVRNLLRSRAPGDDQSGVYQDEHLSIDLPHRRIIVEGKEVHLTRREFDVLKLLLAHKDRVVTQTQLLRDIWVLRASRTPITCASSSAACARSSAMIRPTRGIWSQNPALGIGSILIWIRY